MKFGSNLQAHLTPEWRSQYIDYEVLKSMLYDWKEEHVNAQQDDTNFTVHAQEMAHRQIASFEDQFFSECDMQLTKVNTFFSEKLAEATRRFALLQSEIEAHKQSVLAASGVPATTSLTNRRKSRAKFFLANDKKEKVHHKSLKDLKFAFSEFYLSLILLQNYQELNFTGFRKILKKHDKILDTEKGATWRKNFVIPAPFHSDSFISEYILKTENLFITELEHGDRSKAMKRLRVPPLTDKRTYPKGTVFRVGLFLGMFIVMVAVFTVAAIFLPVPQLFLTFMLYRGGFVLFLFMTCLGFNIWGWRVAGVNHVLIFEIDPRQYLSHQHFFEIASLFSIIWSFSIICYVFGFLPELQPYFPVYLNPPLVYSCYFLFLVNPLPIFFHKARFWLIRRLWRLFACGFYPVEFADFWLADQLNSLVVLFLDAEFIICFYSFDGDIWNGRTGFLCGSYSYGIRAIVSCYPAYIRFIQCLRRYYDTRKWFPHLINAGKYSTTFFRVTFNALYVLHRESTQELQSVYFFLWLASLFISSCYTYVWDIKMDWGFLDSNAGENKFLREEIVYSYKAFYYFAIVEDFVIRFSWIVRVGVEQLASSDSSSLILSNVLAILEVLRRFIWNFFRLENEHLNNCGEFRAVRDISVTPLRADDLATLERMMDDVDGIERSLLKEAKKKSLSKIPSVSKGARKNSFVLYVGETSTQLSTSSL